MLQLMHETRDGQGTSAHLRLIDSVYTNAAQPNASSELRMPRCLAPQLRDLSTRPPIALDLRTRGAG